MEVSNVNSDIEVIYHVDVELDGVSTDIVLIVFVLESCRDVVWVHWLVVTIGHC